MKRLKRIGIFALLLALLALPARAEGTVYAASRGWAIFESGGRYGLMDEAGTVLLEATCDAIEPPRTCADGVSRALLRRGDRYGWYGADGFCDCLWAKDPLDMAFGGRICVIPERDEGDAFGISGNYRLVYPDGSPAGNATYAHAQVLGEGMLALRELGSDTTRVVNERFEELFTLEGGDVVNCSEGLCCFRRGGLYGFCDLEGKVIVEPTSEMASRYCDGYALIYKYSDAAADYALGLVDSAGNVAIPLGTYPRMYGFTDGCMVVMTADRSAAEDGTNWIKPRADYAVLDADLNTICSFSGNYGGQGEGLIRYYTDEGAVLMTPSGELVFQADDINDFSGGLARYHVAEGGETHTASDDVAQTGLYGFVDPAGRAVLPARYVEADRFYAGLCPVREEGADTWSYIDSTGAVAFAGDWDAAYGFDGDGYATVFVGADYWYIDAAGEVVGPALPDPNEAW